MVTAAATAALCASSLAWLPAASAAPAHADQHRQQAFASAATEFGVPEDLLLAVSYLESRWDANAGTPSRAAGFGPMHLTDLAAANPDAGTEHHQHGVDPRGDDARPAVHPDTAPPAGQDTPGLHTVALAAQLTGVDAAALRADATQNIRGGAALLAHYQRELGAAGSDDPAAWYGAVARYAGATTAEAAADFADEVFTTLGQGADRVTDDGQRVRLAAHPVRPDTGQLDRLGLPGGERAGVECPPDVPCDWVPAPYQQLPNNGYGNHDLADRPNDLPVDYIVIHDTEGYWDTAMKLVQDPTYSSWHYTIRSQDGQIAQHVATKDVTWHAGNWFVNARSIGVEHEGFAAAGTWYTETMYRNSAKLVRYLADRYGIPLDRAHILGHDTVPGPTAQTVAGMHWDPGPYWDWAHYFDLLGAPITGNPTDTRAGIAVINPNYATNQPAFTGCDTAAPANPCPARGSAEVVLRTEPRADAPLLTDVGLHPDGKPSTMAVSDIGSRASAGQRYAVAEVRGDWTAVWYLGQKGWFHNPASAPTATWARGWVVTPRHGLTSVPVYGRAYPEAEAYPQGVPVQSVVPLQYSMSQGQRYSVGEQSVDSEYLWATTFDQAGHVVVRGQTKYVQIQFGHRVAYVKADDVTLLPSPIRG